MLQVGIILVNYNGKDYINNCIDSILNQAYEAFIIVVVDNASTDGSYEQISRTYPDIEIIRLEENMGFGEGCNIGIRKAVLLGADYLLLVNTDTVLDKSMLRTLMNYAGEAVVLSPKILRMADIDGRHQENNILQHVWYAGGEIDFADLRAEQILYPDSIAQDSTYEVDFISGCCMLFHKDTIIKTGLFDNNYFMYYEDMDFCIRLKDSGFRLLYVPGAVLWHAVGGSAEGEITCLSQYYVTRNRLYLADKFYRRLEVSSLSVLKCILQERGWFQEKKHKKYEIYIKAAINDYLEGNLGRGFYGKKLLVDNYLPYSGFYPIENDGENEWLWAYSESGEIKLVNSGKRDKYYQVRFMLTTVDLEKTSVNILIDNELILHSQIKESDLVELKVVIPAQSSRCLRLEYNGSSSVLNNAFDRTVTFCIINIQVKQLEESSYLVTGSYPIENDEADNWYWCYDKHTEVIILADSPESKKYRISGMINGVGEYQREIVIRSKKEIIASGMTPLDFCADIWMESGVPKIIQIDSIDEEDGIKLGNDERSLVFQLMNLNVEIIE